MAIKTLINAIKSMKKEYPKLMIYEDAGRVILFSEHRTGIVVDAGNDGTSLPVGTYSYCWDAVLYVDYNEPIIIQNK